MKAGQQTFESSTKDGHVVISVEIHDLADGEFNLYFPRMVAPLLLVEQRYASSRGRPFG
ncbi:hypothetical protein LMG24235_06694 [Paraburkholderia sabiae]|nr:hypothetical protein LMG24235_06694 [Paraburkholderia sabiae]